MRGSVALVGRPNVGKSRLFNRLAGRRIAIVHDQPGVTRDVNAVEIEDANGPYTLLDTGGIGLKADMTHKQLVAAAEEQVFVAVQAAALICFVVDAREGLTPLDEMIAEQLRSFGKEPLLVVNKVDAPEMIARGDEFARLGFGAGVTVSAEHGYGADILREEISKRLPPATEEGRRAKDEDRIRICFAGRPNVGKSSLCNRLFDDERLVVSEVPGTTRDAIELDLDYKPKKAPSDSANASAPEPDEEVWRFRLVDTAGIRRKQRVDTPVEFFSSVRSQRAIETSDIVFLVIDALEGVAKQDQMLLGKILDAGRAVVITVNKWDLALDAFRRDPLPGYKNEREFRDAFEAAVRKELFFLPDSPVLFVSAKTGFSVETILKAARLLNNRLDEKLPTPRVNRLVDRLIDTRAPRRIDGKRFKAYYAVQTGNRPFRIRIFCNRAHKLDDNYRRYLERGFTSEFDLGGCPLRFELVGKEQRYSGAD